jgi:pyruvate formate lyase activating enzyme
MNHPARYWHPIEGGRIQCDLCPRDCKLLPNQRGLCFVRANIDGQMVLTTYGRSSGFCIDPMEKKPLNHFYPGQPILSFGTAGCNLTCKFCQNWDISKSRQMDKMQSLASPKAIAQAALKTKCKAVAFTYNDPVIFLEYAVDVAKACHDVGLKTVAVTAGYIHREARKEFFAHMDAANVDLKAFNEEFYHKLCSAHLDNIKETLLYLKHETNVWFEITDLIIPGENDSDEEIDAMTKWVVAELGPDVPMHFSAFHPDWKMMDKPRTPKETLIRAREIAIKNGVRYAYTGNVHHDEGDTTYCPSCKAPVIKRDWYELSHYTLDGAGNCQNCKTEIDGRFAGPAGTWGRKRVPLRFQSKKS